MDETRVMRGGVSHWSRAAPAFVLVLAMAAAAPASAAGAGSSPITGRAFDASWTRSGSQPSVVASAAAVAATDVSPDAVCCPTATGGPAEGGQMAAVAVDPNNANVVYAGGEAGGVWKSIDGGSSWSRAGTGLATGETSVSSGAIAVDGANSQRLLYGVADDDLSPGQGGGGLYASITGAGSWFHVDLPGCAKPTIRGVAFGAGKAFAGTRCGVAVSSDPQLKVWTVVHPDGSSNLIAIQAVATVGSTVFVCDGLQRVFRSGDSGTTWGPNAGTLPGPCDSIAAAPDSTTTFLALYFHSKGDWRIRLGDTSTATAGDLLRVPTNLCRQPPVPCTPSGRAYVYTARRPQVAAGLGPGKSYSVFAANGSFFYEYAFTPEPVHPIWRPLGATHIDSHGMAIPSNYDPAAGRCRVYLANDGGIYRTEPTGSSCTVSSSRVVKAMHGLHGFGSFGLAVIPRSTCPAGVTAPCPAIYLPANDNGTAGSVTGGHGAAAWHDMNCCGDSGVVLSDWRLPNRVVLPRDKGASVYLSTDGNPPIWGQNVSSTTDMGTQYIASGTAADWLILQVQSLPGTTQPVPANGDYVAIRSPARFGPDDPNLDAMHDTIVRNRTGTAGGWKQIGPALAPFQAGRIQAAGGHATPTIYILQANDRPELGSAQGTVLKGVANAKGLIPSWVNASTGLNRAYDILADPFDPKVVYATDLGASGSSDDAIKVTRDGGGHWVVDSDLTRLATADGRYRMACEGGSGNAGTTDWGFRYQCTLAAVAFDPNDANLRFAVLDPAGVAFSRDAGRHWTPLAVTDPMDRPDAGLFDPNANPATGQGSLYVARHGRGLLRVDARWSTLQSILFQLHDVPPGDTVFAVDETTGVSTRLLRDPDQVYRGSELFDSATTPATHTFHYFLSETHQATAQMSRTVSASDVAAGVAAVDSFWVAESAGDQGSGGVSADFNHDGFDDLAVGVPGEDFGTTPDVGAVAVVYGSANGLTTTGNQLWVQGQDGLSGTPEAGDRAGDALAAGDFNGDGFADLAIGVPQEDVGAVADAGAVQVLFGSASGLVAAGNLFLDQGQNGITDSAEAGDRFGAALAVGEFGNGAQADLAIGVPGEDVSGLADAGAVAVVSGSPTGPTSTGNQLFVQGQNGMQGTTEAGDGFGAALAAGDFGGTAESDLAVGVPGEDIGTTPDAGAVNVIYGSSTGLTVTGNQGFVQGQNGMQGGAEAGDGFGSALAAANLGGTAQADLVVGVPAEDIGTVVDAGSVGVVYGSSTGLVTTGNQLFDQGQLGETVEAGDGFGASVAAANVGGTGEADLLAGVPGEDIGTGPGAIANAGMIVVAFGSTTGVSTTSPQLLTQGANGFQGSPEAEDAYGSAVAVGSFGKTAEEDLAAGTPAEDVGSTVDAGAVFVEYGSPTGIAPTGQASLVQAQAGLLDTPETGDEFGASLAA